MDDDVTAAQHQEALARQDTAQQVRHWLLLQVWLRHRSREMPPVGTDPRPCHHCLPQPEDQHLGRALRQAGAGKSGAGRGLRLPPSPGSGCCSKRCPPGPPRGREGAPPCSSGSRETRCFWEKSPLVPLPPPTPPTGGRGQTSIFTLFCWFWLIFFLFLWRNKRTGQKVTSDNSLIHQSHCSCPRRCPCAGGSQARVGGRGANLVELQQLQSTLTGRPWPLTQGRLQHCLTPRAD